ncbi:hypothetical protein LguiB_006495 [Lonicera macranthoides]
MEYMFATLTLIESKIIHVNIDADMVDNTSSSDVAVSVDPPVVSEPEFDIIPGCAEVFRRMVKLYAIEIGFTARFKKNEFGRVIAVCSERDTQHCDWHVHAVLCHYNAKQPHLLAKDIVRKFKESYGIELPYWNAWYGREVARTDLHGDDEDSYKILDVIVKCIYPICYAMVDAENRDNWGWFVDRLVEILIPQQRTVTFILDRNQGLLDDVKRVFPMSPHSYCLIHLKNNLRANFPVDVLAQTGGNVYDYIDPYLQADIFCKVYSYPIYPVPLLDEDEPLQLDEISPLPSTTKKQPGRPHNSRIKSNGELAELVRRCGRCKQYGRHYRRSCIAPI